jgi:hypothetical protein
MVPVPVRIETKLSKAEQRFLARALTRMREDDVKLLTNATILDTISPMAIMLAFKDQPNRRADILEGCLGLKRKLAQNLPAEMAGALLEQGLSKGVEETTPDAVCAVVTSDELVKLHEPRLIWGLLRHGEWFKKKSSQSEAFFAHILEEILLENLLENLKPPDPKTKTSTAAEMVRLIGCRELLSDKIPIDVRACLLELVIQLGEQPPPVATPKDRTPPPRDVFDARRLFGVLDFPTLAKHLDFAVLDAVPMALALRQKWAEEPVLQIEPDDDKRPTNPPPTGTKKDSEEGPEVVITSSSAPIFETGPKDPKKELKLPDIDVSVGVISPTGSDPKPASAPPPLLASKPR